MSSQAKKRSLEQWQRYIESMHPQEIELGLERVREVAERAGLLPVPATCILIGGTNGKGSNVRLLESLLSSSGYRCASYSSPHLFRFNERVRIQGLPVSDALLVDAFEQIETVRGNMALTYFEFTTLAALQVFKQFQLDFCVLEVGLGGRLDAVNIVDAEAALIASVGLDHTDWLGETREQIGYEKAGILRAGKPLVYGQADMPVSVRQTAEQLNCPQYQLGREFGVSAPAASSTEQGMQLYISRPETQGSASGTDSVQCQRITWELTASNLVLGADNLAMSLQLIGLLGITPGRANLQKAATVSLPGRCEYRHIDGADWFFDVGHNREALQRFLARVQRHTGAPGKVYALCAMLEGKPAVQVAEDFTGYVDYWYLAGLEGVPRARSGAQLYDSLKQVLPITQMQAVEQVATGLRQLVDIVKPGDQVLVFGSFYTVQEALLFLGLDDYDWQLP